MLGMRSCVPLAALAVGTGCSGSILPSETDGGPTALDGGGGTASGDGSGSPGTSGMDAAGALDGANVLQGDSGTAPGERCPASCQNGCAAPCLITLCPGGGLFMAIGAENVYWSDDSGKVSKVSIAGGTATVLATGQSVPQGIAVDGTSVYWANEGTGIGPDGGTEWNGSIMKVPVDGGTPTTLASGQSPVGIAVDKARVYWANSGQGTIMSLPIEGGTPTVLASGQSNPYGIAVDANNVYWTNSGDSTVMREALEGGALTMLSSMAEEPARIALDANNVYWTSLAEGGVMKVPIAGGATAHLIGGKGIGNIAVDGINVYVTGNLIPVTKVPVDGGSSTVVASDMGAAGIVVDAVSVYWSNGAIKRLTPK